jgi:hypothetical protein
LTAFLAAVIFFYKIKHPLQILPLMIKRAFLSIIGIFLEILEEKLRE